MIFTSDDQRFSVQLDQDIRTNIESIAARAGCSETGGILIGHYNPDLNLAVIRSVSGPPQDSRSGRSWFNRGIKGLRKLLDQNWEQGHYYLGEWHLHPFAAPNPSSQDIHAMQTIALSSNYNCPEPILLIIGGSRHNFRIRVFVSVLNRLIELRAKAL